MDDSLFTLIKQSSTPFIQPSHNDFFMRAKNVHNQFTFLNTLSLDDVVFQKEMHDVQRMANALLFSVPSEESHPDEQSLQQMNVILNNEEYGTNSLGQLSRVIGKLVRSNFVSVDSMQRFLQSADECFLVAESIMSEFEKIYIKPHISISEYGTISGVQVPLDWGDKIPLDHIKRLMGIPSEHDVIVIGDTFKDASVPIFFDKESPENLLDAIADERLPGVSMVDKAEHRLVWTEHKDTPDELFNAKRLEGMPSPFDTLIHDLTAFSGPSESQIKLNQDDIEDYVEMSLVGQSLPEPVNIPIGSIYITSEQQWFIDNGPKTNNKTLIKLSDIETFHNNKVTIFPNAHTENGIELSKPTLDKINEFGSINLVVKPIKNSNRLEVSSFDSSPPSLNWENPKDQLQLEVVKNNSRIEGSRGYIDRVYSNDDLKRLDARAFGVDFDFKSELSSLLEALKADTLVDIDIRTNKRNNEISPYYIDVTLYSVTKKGLNVRRLSNIVKSTNGEPPTQSQLKELGMSSSSEFNKKASTLDEVDEKIKNALSYNKVKNISISARNASHIMGIVGKCLPKTKIATKNSSIFDQQQLIKNGKLTHRGDRVFSVDKGANRLQRSSFADSPGSLAGLRSKLNKGQGAQLSLDASSALIIRSPDVFLRDYNQGTTTHIGSVPHVKSLLLSNEKELGVSYIKSDPASIVSYAQAQGVTRASAPDTPPVLTELCQLPSSIDLKIPKPKLDKIWDNVVNNYDFSESIDSNLMKIDSKNSVKLSSVIAGGTGGKTGVNFLIALTKESPALFTSVIQGTGVDLEKLLAGNLSKVTAEQASITVYDVLKASATLFHNQNPELVTHNQMSYYANEVLSRLEPSTKHIPGPELKKICEVFDIPIEPMKKIYTAAYESRKENLRQNDKFIVDESSFLPFGDGSYLSLNATLNSIGRKFNTDKRKELIIDASLKATIRDLCEDFKPLVPDGGIVLNNAFLTDHKSSLLALTMPTSEGDTIQTEKLTYLSAAINEMSKVSYINNGLHKINKPNQYIDPELQNTIKSTMSANIINHSKAIENEVAAILEQSGITTLKVIPHEGKFKSWLENVIMNAVSEDPTELPFNNLYDEVQLDNMLEFAEKALMSSPMLYQMSSPVVLTSMFETAKNQFIISQAINELLASKPSEFVYSNNASLFKRGYDSLAKERGLSPVITSPNKFVENLLPILNTKQLPDDCLNALTSYSSSENRPSNQLARSVSYFIDKKLSSPPPMISDNKIINGFYESFSVECSNPIATILNKEEFNFLALKITPRAPENGNGLKLSPDRA